MNTTLVGMHGNEGAAGKGGPFPTKNIFLNLEEYQFRRRSASGS